MDYVLGLVAWQLTICPLIEECTAPLALSKEKGQSDFPNRLRLCPIHNKLESHTNSVPDPREADF